MCVWAHKNCFYYELRARVCAWERVNASACERICQILEERARFCVTASKGGPRVSPSEKFCKTCMQFGVLFLHLLHKNQYFLFLFVLFLCFLSVSLSFSCAGGRRGTDSTHGCATGTSVCARVLCVYLIFTVIKWRLDENFKRLVSSG